MWRDRTPTSLRSAFADEPPPCENGGTGTYVHPPTHTRTAPNDARGDSLPTPFPDVSFDIQSRKVFIDTARRRAESYDFHRAPDVTGFTRSQEEYVVSPFAR